MKAVQMSYLKPVHATTIIGLRHKGVAVLAGDGQVTYGDMVLKTGARKVRKLYHDQVLAGFAGGAADAFTLFERFEAKLDEFNGNLPRSAVELAKDWRMDRYLRRLDAQVKLRDANAIYLNSLLAQIPGVIPMRRRPQVTQQSYFNFAFRLDTEALGIDNRRFCVALNAELNMPDEFEPPYDPLNGCGLFKPTTKVRHMLNDKYFKAITPSRFSLPVCAAANQVNGVTAHHQILMNTKQDMELYAEAVKKVLANAAELAKFKPGELKKYQGLAR